MYSTVLSFLHKILSLDGFEGMKPSALHLMPFRIFFPIWTSETNTPGEGFGFSTSKYVRQ